VSTFSGTWYGIDVVPGPSRRPHRGVACTATFKTTEALVEHTEWPATIRERRAHVEYILARGLVVYP